ncbi:DUF1523 family protein [Paracoccus sp. p4-l81]|uniref:DUF1523 family protein n=1 Tax=Paracoccus sp. p4-l81 TaxID=3342806 RepID=UPI0035B92CB3
MLRYLSWGLRGVFALILIGFLDYVLPQYDTVRITETYNRLTDLGANAIFYASSDSGTVENAQGMRDIRFISGVRPNGRVIVYRNEDTGWIWPPYFKYDSSNLQAEAANARSTAQAPEWVRVTHYGWRVAWLSIYPNAIKIRPVAGPDAQGVNWPRLIILGLILIGVLTIWRMWQQFRQRAIDPALADVSQSWDRLDQRADAARGRMSGWWDRLRGGKGNSGNNGGGQA